MNIDNTTKECFRRGVKLLYKRKLSRIDLYGRILTLFFHQGKELRNGVFVPLLPPGNELPTFSQFRYWYKKMRDLTYSGAAYNSSHTFDVRGKVVQGQQLPNIPGPGYLFEIHVFAADIYLVSMLNRRRILGRPLIYLIIDVFSGLIVGMSISLEGPNRRGIMLAIENMACDKVAYCRGYGIHITEDDWPSHHLPKVLLANSPEFLLKNSDFLVNALDIEISIALPCRLDWKERFERCFPIYDMNDDMAIQWPQDSVHSLSEPERKSHRLDSCLTLNDFRRLVIDCIIEHNTAHHLSDEYLDAEMIADGVEPYPRDAWKWGIENRVGALRMYPEDVPIRTLPIEAEASVTSKGIRFIDDETTLMGCDWFDSEDLIAYQRGETISETQRHEMLTEHREARDRIIEKARSRISEVHENRTTEKEQDSELDVWGVHRQEDGVGEHSPRMFKGSVERFFAFYNMKTDH
jgi:putative transposase